MRVVLALILAGLFGAYAAGPAAKPAEKTQAKTPAKKTPTQPAKKSATPAKKPAPKKSAAKATAKKASPKKPVLENFAGKRALASLTKKMAENALRVRVWGDSHIGADFFTQKLRELWGARSIGFALPLQPRYQQNALLRYESEDFELLNSKNAGPENYPLGGIIARARSEGARGGLDTVLPDKKFELGLLFKAPSTEPALHLVDADGVDEVLAAPQGGKWAFKRLKITLPLSLTALGKGVELGGYFLSRPGEGYLDTVGINGAKSDLWTRWNERVVKNELAVLGQDLIILAYGSNDALAGGFDKKAFKKNYKRLISIIKKASPGAAILLISPPTVTQKFTTKIKKKQVVKYRLAPDFADVRAAIREVAREEGALLFDMHTAMQKGGGKAEWIKRGLSKEDVHLTRPGYERLAEELGRELKSLLAPHHPHKTQ